MSYEKENIEIKTDEFWFNDISIIYNSERIIEFIPSSFMTNNEKLNSLLRLSIIITFSLFFYKQNYYILMLPLIVALITLYIYKFNTIENKKEENFNSEKCIIGNKENPFGNTLLTDVGIYKEKAPTCLAEENNEIIEGNFNKGLFKDVNDLYGKNNSQRQFFTMPNTNEYGVKSGDTVKFANWLYNLEDSTCKEDTSQCIVINNQK
jgi:hypothetical protein